MKFVVFEKGPEYLEREEIRKLFLYLEDRRILYSPRTGQTIASHMVLSKLDARGCLSEDACKSILEIRERIGETLTTLPEHSAGIGNLKGLRAVCRRALEHSGDFGFGLRFLDDERDPAEMRESPDYNELNGYGATMFAMTYLGVFRRQFGRNVNALANLFDLAVSSSLASTVKLDVPLKDLESEYFIAAERLVGPYMRQHGGFVGLYRGWFNRLCSEFDVDEL